MSAHKEPAYRTAYAETGAPVCPECGHDFTGEPPEGVYAHIEGLHPGFNTNSPDELANHGDSTAADRRATLHEIAKGLKG